MNQIIEPARPEELPDILRVYRAAKAYMRRNGNLHQWTGGYPSGALLLSDMEKGNLFAIKNGREICGVFAFIIGEDPTYGYMEDGSWTSDSPYGTIHRIASDGTQRQILEQAVRYCEQRIGHLRIDTHADNRIMQEAVLRSGFQRCGIIYLEDGSPRIAYERLTEKE